MKPKSDLTARTSYAKNSTVALLMSLIGLVAGFVTQRVFVTTLGVEMLGFNSVLTSLISMLAIAELGLASAMIYQLYLPLAKNDTVKTAELMSFYKSTYRFIALIIFVLACLILPALPAIADTGALDINPYIAFSFFAADSVVSYLLSYRRSILYADRLNYVVNYVHIVYLLVMNTLQIVVLISSESFYLFLTIKVLSRLVENIVIYIISGRRYPDVWNSPKTVLNKKTKSELFQNMKGLAFHKVAGFAVMGSDAIMISIFLGLKTAGLYANYALIVTALISITGHVAESIRSTIGKFLTSTPSPRNRVKEFNRISRVGFLVSTICAVGFATCSNFFVTIWIGEDAQLQQDTVLILAVALFLQTARAPYHGFKEAAGIFHADRWMPVIEALIKISFSIFLAFSLGLNGIVTGTVLSLLFLYFYSYPKYLMQPLFGIRPFRHFVTVITNLLGAALCYLTVNFLLVQLDAASSLGNLTLGITLTLAISTVAYSTSLVIQKVAASIASMPSTKSKKDQFWKK